MEILKPSQQAKLIPLTFKAINELFRVVPTSLVKAASVHTKPRYMPARSTLGFSQFNTVQHVIEQVGHKPATSYHGIQPASTFILELLGSL
jgi:hypothetical protein